MIITPIMGEAELKDLLRVVDRIRMVHNGEYVLSPVEAAELIHRRYSDFGSPRAQKAAACKPPSS